MNYNISNVFEPEPRPETDPQLAPEIDPQPETPHAPRPNWDDEPS
jgi:hypothetical protein